MTKAKTRAAKRGRPSKAASIYSREPNGRLSRRKQRTELLEHQIMEVAVSRRVRRLGLVDNNIETAMRQALDPRHGYLLGRMLIDGSISRDQHDAGIKYGEDMARYYGLTGVPFPSARAQDLFAVKATGLDEDQSKADRAKRARAKMAELRGILQGVGDINTARRILHTINVVCVEDIDELRTLNPPMKAWLVRGLNALARHYGI